MVIAPARRLAGTSRAITAKTIVDPRSTVRHLPAPRLARAAVAAAALALTLAACSSGTSGASGDPSSAPQTPAAESSAAAFPVTIDDALGGATIDKQPERVVAWGWGAADAALALGVVPVAIPHQSYGGDKDGVLPWIREAVAGMGAQLPTVLPDSGDDVPYEAIQAAKPDVILAPYSGLTQEQRDTLTAIAPVVAYPDQPWATPWRDVVTIAGKALGRSTAATQVLEGIDAQVKAARDAHPELAGHTVAAVWDTGSTFYVYTPADPRVQFLTDLGLVSAPSVEALDSGESSFYLTLSHERLSELTSDLLVVYGSTQAEADAFLTAPYAQVMPQVTGHAVAQLIGTELIASVSPPTALSITWGLDRTVAALSTAVSALG